MTESWRLPAGGRIDRSRRLAFRFDGRVLEGRPGDTLASALLANGVHLVARSFKYHRPRGIVSAGIEEPNAIVQLGEGGRIEPNARATQVELYDGLVARSVNAWPNAGRDIAAVTQLFAPLLVTGFYYKTFKRPKLLWDHVFEPAIRHMAGFGRAPTAPDADAYDRMHRHCDVLVVGGGPAGLSAALAAARSGARVVLADEQAELGGALLGSAYAIDGAPAVDWVARTVAELRSFPDTLVLTRTTIFGYYDQNYLCAVERRTDHLGPAAPAGAVRKRLWHFRAKRVVLATGSHERPLVFADNDRPGIMLANAARSYAHRWAVAPGRQGIVVTNNDSAYGAARDLADAGVTIAAMVDLRRRPPGALVAEMQKRGIAVFTRSAVVATHGGRRVETAEIASLGSDGIKGTPKKLECDFIAMSGGWNPAVHLFSQSQGRLRWDDARACLVPGQAAQPQHVAGAANGSFTLRACIAEGLAAGTAAVQALGFTVPPPPAMPEIEEEPDTPPFPVWLVPWRDGRMPRKHFLDFQNDATAADVLTAVREGMESPEHVKRYAAIGLGTDQGKTGNVNAHALLAEITRRGMAETGTTTMRPPYSPVTFGALAGPDRGELIDPVRTTPLHDRHVDLGAVFENVGQWKRPWYYSRAGETLHDAVARECRAVREGVGILDASTLGKIELHGPDAVALLERVYTNAWKGLAVGSCRYGLMCRDDGMVFDDGVTTRLGEQSWFMTTTTGNAARVMDWLEEWLQTEWPELRVWCTSVTEHWGTVSLSGPRARDVMQVLAPTMPLDVAAFPFMTMREGVVAGVAARVFRVGFTGELTYEINVPCWQAPMVWDAAIEAGAPFGITPFGTEAMHVLRAEKGFIIVGQETDGSVTPHDLGMGWIVSKKKGDFIGRRSLGRSDTARADRKQLVGLLTEEPGDVLPEGAQLVETALKPLRGRAAAPVPMIGHVTSSYLSPALGRSIALGLVKNGRARIGSTVWAPLDGRTVAARVVEPVFYDVEGKRRDG